MTFFNTPCGCTYNEGRKEWRGCEAHGRLDTSHKKDREALAYCKACQEVPQ